MMLQAPERCFSGGGRLGHGIVLFEPMPVAQSSPWLNQAIAGSAPHSTSSNRIVELGDDEAGKEVPGARKGGKGVG